MLSQALAGGYSNFGFHGVASTVIIPSRVIPKPAPLEPDFYYFMPYAPCTMLSEATKREDTDDK